MRIVFMGTPDFSVPALKALVEAGHQVIAVVTQPDKPKGRGKAVSYTHLDVYKRQVCGELQQFGTHKSMSGSAAFVH